VKKPEMKFRNELILFFFLLVAIPTIDLLIFRATENLYVAVAVLASLLVFLVFGLLNMDRIIDIFQKTEKSYRLLVESASDGIFTTDAEERISFSNQKMASIFGYARDEIKGKRIGELISPESSPEFMKFFKKEGERGVLEGKGRRRDGQSIFVQFNVTPLENGQKLCIVRDITKARELEQMKEDFISHVTHELRSPLSAIDSYVNVLMSSTDTAKRMEYLNIIKNNTAHLAHFIDNLLDIAKIEKQKIELVKDYVNIYEIAGETVELFRQQAEEKRLSIVIDIPEDILEIMGDHDKLRQVMNNLVSNAIKYTPEGGRIAICAVEKEKYLEVSVSDTGIGINPEETEKIFEKFHQSRTPGRGRKEGAGLGLAIVKGIVEAHGGKIEVRSQPHHGSIFTVTLPR